MLKLKSPYLRASATLHKVLNDNKLLQRVVVNAYSSNQFSKLYKVTLALQSALNRLGIEVITDGNFGPTTERKVKLFQSSFIPTNTVHEDYSIGSADGIVGKNTLLALDEALVLNWKCYPDFSHTPFAELLGSVESNNDYTAYNCTKPKLKSFYDTNLTRLTLKQVMTNQRNSTMFAVGRYQLIPSTLKLAVRTLDLDKHSLFDKSMQDRIFNEYLISVKRKAIKDFLIGNGDVDSAIYEWAKEFASAGVKAGNKISKGRIAKGGESYYSGDGFNKAHISPEEMIEVLERSKIKT